MHGHCLIYPKDSPCVGCAVAVACSMCVLLQGQYEMDVNTFCERSVDVMGEESDHIHAQALTDAVEVRKQGGTDMQQYIVPRMLPLQYYGLLA